MRNKNILLIRENKPVYKEKEQTQRADGEYAIEKKTRIDALEIFQNSAEKYDMVIIDNTVHPINGIKLAEELIQIRNDVPIIFRLGHKIPKKTIEFAIKSGNTWKIARMIKKFLKEKKDEARASVFLIRE